MNRMNNQYETREVAMPEMQKKANNSGDTRVSMDWITKNIAKTPSRDYCSSSPRVTMVPSFSSNAAMALGKCRDFPFSGLRRAAIDSQTCTK